MTPELAARDLAGSGSWSAPRRWRMRHLAWAALTAGGLALALFGYQSKPRQPLERPEDLTVVARMLPHLMPDQPGRTRFGELEYLGGLELHAESPYFGGLSGLSVSDDGRQMVAVTDAGHFLTAKLVYQQHRLAGLRQGRIFPLHNAQGLSLKKMYASDVEALVWQGDRAWISHEDARGGILRLTPTPQDIVATPIRVPEALRTLPEGRGIEALAIFPRGHARAGQLLAIAERSPVGGSAIPGWILAPSGAQRLWVEQTEGFDISDASFTPRGGLLLLERRLALSQGFAIRIRYIPPRAIQADQVLRGRTVFQGGSFDSVLDNMEGLALHHDPEGATLLSLVSDDNFRSFQKTVLLQFRWREADR